MARDPGPVVLRPVRAGDYDHVIERLDDWWGDRDMAAMLPRLFFEHFPRTSVVADDGSGRPAGFLCGFRSQADAEVASIHFVGVDPAHRGSGIGRVLYEWFFDRTAELGCRHVRCVTSPVNQDSLAFHEAMGFEGRLVLDHDRPGQDRVALQRPLPSAETDG